MQACKNIFVRFSGKYPSDQAMRMLRKAAILSKRWQCSSRKNGIWYGSSVFFHAMKIKLSIYSSNLMVLSTFMLMLQNNR